MRINRPLVVALLGTASAVVTAATAYVILARKGRRSIELNSKTSWLINTKLPEVLARYRTNIITAIGADDATACTLLEFKPQTFLIPEIGECRLERGSRNGEIEATVTTENEEFLDQLLQTLGDRVLGHTSWIYGLGQIHQSSSTTLTFVLKMARESDLQELETRGPKLVDALAAKNMSEGHHPHGKRTGDDPDSRSTTPDESTVSVTDGGTATDDPYSATRDSVDATGVFSNEKFPVGGTTDTATSSTTEPATTPTTD